MQLGEIKRFGEHENAFGFLRLLFASLVIVSHTPEMADGNPGRELLTQAFGTISFGEFAVDSFFIVSGYLITGSYLKNPDAWSYLKKRVLRIYPAFLVVSAISIFCIAPFVGADWATITSSLARHIGDMIRLDPPFVEGAFKGTPYRSELNGAAWTIAYEFRCYILVLILGTCGIFNRPWVVTCPPLVPRL